MPNNIRDFVYFDLERVRSLVSQLEQGIVESVSASLAKESVAKGSVKAGILGLTSGAVGVEQLWRNDNQENRSLNDYIFTKLEDALIERKLLKRIDQCGPEESSIEEIKDVLKTANFALINAHIEINDISRMRMIIERYNDLGKFLAWTTAESSVKVGVKRGGAEYQKLLKDTEAKLQIDRRAQEGLSLVLKELIGDKIILRAKLYPGTYCVGVLDPRFLREEMGSFLIKYGTRPTSQWVIFCQLASKNPHAQDDPAEDPLSGGIFASMLKVHDSIRKIDHALKPYGPADITITPIAVYRQH